MKTKSFVSHVDPVIEASQTPRILCFARQLLRIIQGAWKGGVETLVYGSVSYSEHLNHSCRSFLDIDIENCVGIERVWFT